MNKKLIKDWTILIYADGNNELEPEMYQSKIDMEEMGSSNKINVILQIARESIDLVKIIRPSYSITERSDNWTGVRRYYILKSESVLLKDLGKTNMADPHTLYNFIKWGIEAYPSKHYMVVLSGHGGGFVSVMSDLSQDKPYMMGIYEMCKVINMIINDINAQIDILAFDLCDMNHIEIMYELGKNKKNTVKTVLAYIGDGIISGLPYNKLIYLIEQHSNEYNNNLILKNMIDYLDLNLVAIEINHTRLQKIKRIVHTIAYLYLTQENYRSDDGFELLNTTYSETSWYKYVLKLQNEIKSIVIYYKNSSFSIENIINVLDLITRKMCNTDALNKYLPIYYKLTFAKNNYWFNLLSNTQPKDSLIYNTDTAGLKPLIITQDELKFIISAINPPLNDEELKSILGKLCLYRKWHFSPPNCGEILN